MARRSSNGSRRPRGGDSSKTPVFEHLFLWRYDERGNKIGPRYDSTLGTIPEEFRTVYTDECVAACKELDKPIGNKWAYFKDLVRYETRDSNWPDKLKKMRWSAVQVTGGARNRNFRFVPYLDDQPEDKPFLDDCPLDPQAEIIPIQSVTMSIASKQIERIDEPRLMQIAVELRIIESHFSMRSPLAKEMLHIDHIQLGMKLGGSEIDALFQAEIGPLKTRQPKLALITVEAKQQHEHVTFAQVLAQVLAASKLGIEYDMIIPLVVKHRLGGIHVVEFGAFERDTTDFRNLSFDQLERKAEAFYRVYPPVQSLGEAEDSDDSLMLFGDEEHLRLGGEPR